MPQALIRGENGATSVVDYPFSGRSKRVFDYLKSKHLISIQELPEDEEAYEETSERPSPAQMKRITPKR
jgi:hypothetical protein